MINGLRCRGRGWVPESADGRAFRLAGPVERSYARREAPAGGEGEINELLFWFARCVHVWLKRPRARIPTSRATQES